MTDVLSMAWWVWPRGNGPDLMRACRVPSLEQCDMLSNLEGLPWKASADYIVLGHYTPTQTKYPSHKVRQSDPTPGFHLLKLA